MPLSMIEPLINETVERLMLLKEAKKPKPKRVTRDLILDAIGCPNLALVRWTAAGKAKTRAARAILPLHLPEGRAEAQFHQPILTAPQNG